MSLTTTTTTTKTTFLTIYRTTYLKRLIFDYIAVLTKPEQERYSNDSGITYTKGRDIINQSRLVMISSFAMPWDFIKHYLPPRDNVLFARRMDVITRYCAHPNATIDTFNRLLEWTRYDYTYSADWIKSSRYYLYKLESIRNMEILEYVATTSVCVDLKIVANRVAQLGNMNILKQLSSSWTYSCMDLASFRGNLEMVQYLYQNSTAGCSKGALDGAASNGHLDVVMFLHANSTQGCTERAMTKAAIGGHLEVVKFLYFNRTEGCSKSTFNEVVATGRLDIIKFFHENGIKGCTKDAMTRAARLGHFDVVKWLHFNRTEGCTHHAMDYAKSLEILQFLHQCRTEGATSKAMDYAANVGALDILKFLHFNRTEGCTTNAVDRIHVRDSNIHLNVLKFLRENRTEGCTIDAIDRNLMSLSANLEIIKYINENFKMGITREAVQRAAMNGRLDMIEYFHQQFPVSDSLWNAGILNHAVISNNIDIVKFLHYNRTEVCGTSAMDTAAEKGNLDLVKFLHENRTEGCTVRAMTCAARNSHFEMVKWLHENRTEGCTAEALLGWNDNQKFNLTFEYIVEHKLVNLYDPDIYNRVINFYSVNGYYEFLDYVQTKFNQKEVAI
ncbi:hypothetical protein DFA_00155 [Cavenderia fasciculata]|uniref:Ankyrin repeat-containing protein n=1 Tax=Cavenderia fasciculata TaxID=261658 RepID=F4PXR7_CACFS|nr:uncharacterized protein DFA_00155 [Cavenderia fasciculata]EGG19577.1 hypothetical protein DFA_00155 [Cavenderia fasciculata]|eukprot:XP_004357871.1 hypothetical protein DFA_00155 [Cavenderia fasciculata]